MNAARILAESGIDGDELRAALLPIRPEDVNVWPAAKPVRMLWCSGVRGVTLGCLVLVDPELLARRSPGLGRLVVHELVHVRQFAELGYFGFMLRYLSEYLTGRLDGQSHRDAYLAISAEAEARDIAERFA